MSHNVLSVHFVGDYSSLALRGRQALLQIQLPNYMRYLRVINK